MEENEKLKNIVSTSLNEFDFSHAFNGEINVNTKFIYAYAFVFCGDLKEIDIQKGVISIDKFAFADCINIEKIKYKNRLEQSPNGDVKTMFMDTSMHLHTTKNNARNFTTYTTWKLTPGLVSKILFLKGLRNP